MPGVSTMAVLLAATYGIFWLPFLSYDPAGSELFMAFYLVLARLLGDRFDQLSRFAGLIESVTFILAAVLAAVILGRRFYNKRRSQRDASVRRISPDDLLRLIEEGRTPFIVDLRHPLDMLTDPRMIPGAIRMTPDELSSRLHEIPQDREIILYCTCPNEDSSAQLALTLRRNGIKSVRPLLGGFDEWKRRGYQVEDAKEKIGWRANSQAA
jgi:rhodanese-related sulfurtransferase